MATVVVVVGGGAFGEENRGGGERSGEREEIPGSFLQKNAMSAPDRRAQPVSFRVNTYKQLF